MDKQMLSNLDEKGFVPDEVRNAFFRKLRMKSENRSCLECTARNPSWNSLTYGTYLCLECSGEHRRKGVHLSFVRSVELDRFTPEQMIQMAVGGNGKALQYFKASGMGKTSDSGRAIDYSSKIAVRYKQQMEKETADVMAKFGVLSKSQRSAGETLLAKEVEEVAPPEPVEAQRSTTAPAALGGYPQASAASKAPAAIAAAVAATPKSAAAPTSNIKVLTGFAPPAVAAPMQTMAAPATALTGDGGVPKPSGFAAKQKAKEVDFDFDFDFLEKEAVKPAPAPVPKASPAPAAAPVSAPVRPKPIVPAVTASPPAASAPPAAAAGGSRAMFGPSAQMAAAAAAAAAAKPAETELNSKTDKAFSSADFFKDVEEESATQRVEAQNRMDRVSGDGAISSDTFFGDGNSRQGEGRDGLGTRGNGTKQALSKGAELLSTYLNKVRD